MKYKVVRIVFSRGYKHWAQRWDSIFRCNLGSFHLVNFEDNEILVRFTNCRFVPKSGGFVISDLEWPDHHWALIPGHRILHRVDGRVEETGPVAKVQIVDEYGEANASWETRYCWMMRSRNQSWGEP